MNSTRLISIVSKPIKVVVVVVVPGTYFLHERAEFQSVSVQAADWQRR